MNKSHKKNLITIVFIIINYFICYSVNYKSKREILNKISLFSSPQIKKNNYIEKLKESLKKANSLYEDEKYTESLEILLFILDETKEEKNTYELKYRCNFLIGNILRKRNNHEKALSYFKQSLKDLENSNYKAPLDKKITLENNHLNKANSLLRIGTEYFELKKNDSAKFFFSRIIEIPSVTNEIKSIKASAYGNLSATFLNDSLYDKAKMFAEKAIEIHNENNNNLSESAAMSNLASIYLEENNYKKAKNLYINALKIIEHERGLRASKYREQLYYNLAWTLYLLKDYKAYEYQERSYMIKDTLTEKEMKRIVKGVFEKHKIDLEKQRAETLKNQIELEKHQKRTTNYLLGALSLLILTISGVVIYNYTLRQRNLHLKIEQNKLVEQQKIAQIKSDSQKMILNAAIDGKETERKQIAETLHDSVSALLSSANMHLLATKRQFNGNTPVELDKTQKIILEASQKVRDLSHNLVSSILLKFGLEYSLQDITQKYSNSELTFHPNMSNIPRYDQDFEIKMYNVIHELINNIIKHSKAANAYIVLEDTGDFLSVLIEDDGVGFNYRNSKVKSGLGLNQIEARIQMMNGNIIIESAENRGTKITMSVPTIKKKEVNLV
ncbi:tetratricopeptide repeat protein [Tenacibaculum sp. 190524A02b]|uniref:tetratricopeptide repeat-containing sensor histidine kinase n=1 Tax=Tenacibaculum vairaonense TaxID=3137860 RepID=UPI0031FB8919